MTDIETVSKLLEGRPLEESSTPNLIKRRQKGLGEVSLRIDRHTSIRCNGMFSCRWIIQGVQ